MSYPTLYWITSVGLTLLLPVTCVTTPPSKAHAHFSPTPLGSEMKLDDFPLEILVRVFSFLPARFLILKVILVCQKFHDIIKDEWFWKERFVGCCGSEFSVRVGSMETLQLGCVQSEFVHGACNGNASYMNTVNLPGTCIIYKYLLAVRSWNFSIHLKTCVIVYCIYGCKNYSVRCIVAMAIIIPVCCV